ncbi:hypothetical protein [Chlorogloeopsis sp. ULAP02]
MFLSSIERINWICHKMDANQGILSEGKKTWQQSITDNWKNP